MTGTEQHCRARGAWQTAGGRWLNGGAMAADAGISITRVDDSTRDIFLDYAAAHGPEHDDSYLAPEDRSAFDPLVEPTVLAYSAGGELVGAASLMVDGYISSGLGRFRLLHATDNAAYVPLLAGIRPHIPDGIRTVFLFLPEESDPPASQLASLGFAETRRAYVLKHAAIKYAQLVDPPSGTHLTAAMPSVAEEWAHVVNAAFRGAPGRYDMSEERAAELLARDRVIRGGTLIAWRSGSPAGIVSTVADPDDPYDAEIETLAVTPGNQGLGLGRALLHAAVVAAARTGRITATLSVSTTNRRALSLYLDAGFNVADVRVCWEASVL